MCVVTKGPEFDPWCVQIFFLPFAIPATDCDTTQVCCIDFDAEDRHFATVSVSRTLKVFDFENALRSPASASAAYPAWQATTRSKLSGVAWNPYMRTHLATCDYDGLVQVCWVVLGCVKALL